MSEAGASRGAVATRQRWLTLGGLLAVTLLAWVYLWLDAQRMASMSPGEMAAAARSAWAVEPLLLVFLMWSVMMVGMMLPSAAPAILLYGTLARTREPARAHRLDPAWAFTGGYLAVWTLFSLGATLLQAALSASGLLNPMMRPTEPGLSAAVLIIAGIYQWLPYKEACLRRCRSPLQTFLFHWRPSGFRMGAAHGAFCVGCCWSLMLVLFATGVMELLWAALIAAFVLAEKLLPGGRWLARVAGAGLIAAGVNMSL